MSIENITLFRNCMLSQAGCKIYEKAFDKIDQLELPAIERVKFHRWNLGMGRSQKARLLPMFLILQPSIQT